MEATVRTIPKLLWWLLMSTGAAMVVVGLIAAVGAFLLPRPQSDPFGVVSMGVGLAVLALGVGLLVSALRGSRGMHSPPFFSRWAWLICLGGALVLGIVGALLPGTAQVFPAFGIIHVSLVALPALAGLILVILAAGAHAAPTWREAILALSGGVLSTIVALPIELLGFVMVIAVVTVVAMLFPGGTAEIDRLLTLLDQWSVAPPADSTVLLGVLRSPAVIAALALILAVVAPLIEEFGKMLVIGVLGFWRRFHPATAFLLGACSGVGFAVVEGVSNGALGLGGGGWLGGIGVRFLATAMHALASGLIGLGWGWAWRRRWWAVPLMYVVAVVYHGFWNLNVVMGIAGYGLTATPDAGLGTGIVVLAVAFELMLILGTPVVLFGVPLLLRRKEAAAAAASNPVAG